MLGKILNVLSLIALAARLIGWVRKRRAATQTATAVTPPTT